MRVSELMPHDVVTVSRAESLRGATKLLIDDEVGALLVVGSSDLDGVFSERDLARAVAEGADLDDCEVADYMTAAPVTADLEGSLTDLVRQMNQLAIRHFAGRQGERWLEPDEVSDLLAHYGIPTAAGVVVDSAEGVVEKAAAEIAPVAVKIVSSPILHKSDVGGVRVGLTSPALAGRAAHEMLESLTGAGRDHEVEGFLVQEMAPSEGAEVFIGVTDDQLFGPLIACGAGGTMVELMRDVAVRITPLTDVDATEMLRSLKSWPLFEGYRGQPRLDSGSLEELLLRLSVLVEDLPHIAELDLNLNPVLVSPSLGGSVVLDARVRVVTPRPASPLGARIAPGRRAPPA